MCRRFEATKGARVSDSALVPQLSPPVKHRDHISEGGARSLLEILARSVTPSDAISRCARGRIKIE
jgi:hypothetical protein